MTGKFKTTFKSFRAKEIKIAFFHPIHFQQLLSDISFLPGNIFNLRISPSPNIPHYFMQIKQVLLQMLNQGIISNGPGRLPDDIIQQLFLGEPVAHCHYQQGLQLIDDGDMIKFYLFHKFI